MPSLSYGIFALVILYLFRLWMKQWSMANKLKQIPGPKPNPILGNSLDFKNFKQVIPTMVQYQSRYGSTFKSLLGNEFFVFTSEPALIEGLLTSSEQVEKTKIYNYLSNFIGKGLICSGTPRWQQHRKLITPSFGFNVLKDFISVFEKNAKNLVGVWREKMSNNRVELDTYNYIMAYTLETLVETIMGISVDFLRSHKHSEYFNAVQFMGRISINRSIHPWHHIDWMYKLSATYRQEMKHVKSIEAVTDDVIRQKRLQRARETRKTANFHNDAFGLKQRKAFLDHLIDLTKENGSCLNDEELRDEVHTFIFAGHDSTASCACFTLYLLSKHPAVQEKLYKEIVSILVGSNGKIKDITFAKLNEMKYLEMVLKESLRLYPLAAIFLRKLTKNVNYNGIHLPKDLNVGVFAYGAHRNPEIYTNANEFIPERFESENSYSKNGLSFVPFSAGPRNCIGQKFAMLELKCLISILLHAFKISKRPDFEVELVTDGMLKSCNGIQIILEPREK